MTVYFIAPPQRDVFVPWMTFESIQNELARRIGITPTDPDNRRQRWGKVSDPLAPLFHVDVVYDYIEPAACRRAAARLREVMGDAESWESPRLHEYTCDIAARLELCAENEVALKCVLYF